MKIAKAIQKENLKEFHKMCRLCDMAVNATNQTHYVIKEYNILNVFSQEEYDLIKDQIDGELMILVYTKRYRKPVLTFKDAKNEADIAAKEKGGIWHVIQRKGIYNEVSEHYFKTHPDVESLYESELYESKDINKQLIKLGVPRIQRRKILGKNAN